MNQSMKFDYIKQGDCLELMKEIPDKSIDMVLCDLPYEVLCKSNESTKWDKMLPMNKLWEQYERVIKQNGAIVLFGSGMFTAQVMTSNPSLWRYNLIWHKDRATGFLNASKMPLRCHEDIMVFYKQVPTYNAQMEELNGREPSHSQGYGIHRVTNNCYGNVNRIERYEPKDINKKFPQSIIYCKKEHDKTHLHPTQKPVEILRYLIRTYSNEGDIILDNTMGSGSTCIAAIRERRHYIGIELDVNYFDIAGKRILEELAQPELF